MGYGNLHEAQKSLGHYTRQRTTALPRRSSSSKKKSAKTPAPKKPAKAKTTVLPLCPGHAHAAASAPFLTLVFLNSRLGFKSGTKGEHIRFSCLLLARVGAVK
jgi:hypothetical protein